LGNPATITSSLQPLRFGEENKEEKEKKKKDARNHRMKM